MNTFGKKILPILVFLGILVPSSVVLAATTTITNSASENIPDSGCIDKTFNMASSVVTTDIIIEVNIDHPRREDLDINLISPQGTSVDLTSDNGSYRDNLHVRFDDTAATSITADYNNHTVTVDRSPEQALSAFDGKDALGTWTLHICDDRNRNTGRFNYTVLDINDTPPPPPPPIGSGLVVEYHMDECYWLDNAGGVTGDVKDGSQNGYDATSYNTASVSVGQINSAGLFSSDGDLAETEDATAGNTPGSLSVSFWAKLDQQLGSYAVVLTKSKDWDWNDGWGFVNPNSSASDTLRFYINYFAGTYIDTTLTTADGWTHFAGTYDGKNLRLYKNGVEVTGSPVSDNSGITNSNDPIRMAFDNSGDATLKGNLDEVKVWDRALRSEEVASIEGNETIGNNYDGTSREPVACGATVAANSWELVGIPIDLRTDPKTVAETFQGMGGIYGTDWRIYRRDYSDTNNSSWYTYLDDPDSNMTEFGKAYWLGNKQTAQNWNVDGTQAVDYDSSFNGTSDCVANRCVELDIKSVSLDEASDDLNGTGSYRYNMTGFVGKAPVDWADCRFVIDGTVYTPTEAETEGYAAKQIWQYNPGGGNDYTTCDDTMACKLIPFEGFWIELHGKTKNKTVKLLIPQE